MSEDDLNIGRTSATIGSNLQPAILMGRSEIPKGGFTRLLVFKAFPKCLFSKCCDNINSAISSQVRCGEE